MHADTLSAARLLLLALATHPEDVPAINVYGRMAEHLADLAEDHIDGPGEEEEEE